MTFGQVASLVGVAVLVLVANVAASIGYMVVYGHVIDPGHEAEYYNDHIQIAGPWRPLQEAGTVHGLTRPRSWRASGQPS